MRQEWLDLLFAHWPLAPEAIAPLVPAPLQLDTFEGRAWVGVVPFRMRDVRSRLLPALPWLSAFPELNVRTYVRFGGKSGVYFFSLDAGNILAALGGRLAYRLPYFHARMSAQSTDGIVVYESRRLRPARRPATFVARYRPSGPAACAMPGSLADWLTARLCLFTVDRAGRCYRADIEHAPWPLQPAEAEIAVNTMALPAGIALPGTQPLLHFSLYQDVRVWPIRRVA
jgi:uncharacterized protein YqjF (DUF2071 family)